jgi:hypothetical protein
MGLACWAAQEEEGREESWAAAQKQRGSSSLFFQNSVLFCFQILLHFEICLKLQTFCNFSKYSWPS